MFFDRLRTLSRARAFYEVENIFITSLLSSLTYIVSLLSLPR